MMENEVRVIQMTSAAEDRLAAPDCALLISNTDNVYKYKNGWGWLR